MRKYVINNGYGGFSLSFAAAARIIELGGEDILSKYCVEEMRNKPEAMEFVRLVDDDLTGRCHPILVQVVEELGDKANGACARLKVVEAYDDPESLELDEYDGFERLRTRGAYFG